MSSVKCPECGKEISDKADTCPNCGYPIMVRPNTAVNKGVSLITLKPIRNIFIIAALVCFIASGVFFHRGHNVKNDYYNSEDYTIFNKNAYVGGDAYNYIINGTYFTGYSVIGSAALLSGMICVSNALRIAIKIKEYE